MNKSLLTILFSLSISLLLSQSRDSASAARRDSIIRSKMGNAVYPLIKEAKMGGVITIQNPEEMPDPKMKFKILFNFTQGATSSAKSKEMNGALAEVARVMNLHIAAGVPKKNLDIVLISHASALFSLLDDTHYRKKFKIDNPNGKLIKELQEAGVLFTVCGQAMNFLDIERESLLPGIKLAYSAKTVITNYNLKGYVLTDVNE